MWQFFVRLKAELTHDLQLISLYINGCHVLDGVEAHKVLLSFSGQLPQATLAEA
jgi:hypothetical protein